MPMAPSALAVVTYGSVKLIGYFIAAKAINTQFYEKYSPLKFAALKTVTGFLVGVVFLFFFLNYSKTLNVNENNLIYYAAPLRYIIWLLILKICWQRLSGKKLLLFSFLGLGYTYLLDGLMVVLFKITPGMEIPWC